MSAEATIRTLLSPTWLLGVWDRLRTSFWFLPSAMAAAAVALSFGLVKVDAWVNAETVRRLGWIYEFGPEGARAVLSAIASSMITVAGLTFSITMLTLQLASSQFGPRLLRNFMRDRGNQIVLGTFTSTFLYCLLVLRTVRGTEGASFVPHLSVAFGVLLATLSLAVLIYFIHHVAISIRIETVLADLAAETRSAIDRLYPERLGRDPPVGDVAGAYRSTLEHFESRARPIGVKGSGYVQRVDEDALMRIATEHDVLVRIEARPGRFITDCDPIVLVAPSERISDEAAAALRGAFVVGPDRTPAQDLEFSLRRIVEIAQRALSPGINDPTTALYCIDRLGEALGRLAEREIPSSVRADPQGRPRIVTSVGTLEDLACPALAAVARYATGDADVIRKLLRIIEALTQKAGPRTRDRILALGQSIERASRDRLSGFDKDAMATLLLAEEASRPPSS
ncbi:DUF2254 domain-containing protein [Rhizobiales bacterium L72]|uniref:DUF2254 domain-containing protein n=2 Tax=Propylenella binzhouense TaxID=2555902 RepID=A0A964WVR8_9HYPH|nr:DUF2254 domain-containing protein [Propylenella binzhouense]